MSMVRKISDAEFEGMIADATKRDREQELAFVMASKQRVADSERVKGPRRNQPSTQVKFLKFDHTEAKEQNAKHPCTGGMSSPTFAGDLISNSTPATSSPSTTTDHVRRIIEEIEEKIPLDVNDQLLDGDFSEHEISEVDKAKRGFHDENAGLLQVENAGLLQVSAGELAWLDKHAMYAELERVGQLEVISDGQAGLDVSEALHLDTKLVRDWSFRRGCWTKRARMAARECRGQSASTEETFSPTTLLVLVKVFMVISVVRKLMMSALDVSDAFLQVWRKENVVVSVPNWVRVAANDISLMFWQLRKCLPGQRNAATRWDDHLTQLLEELNFVHMQGTIF